MEEWILQLFTWLGSPDTAALTTVVGLAAFLKLIGVPFVKWLAVKFKKELAGTNTVIAVYVLSFIIAMIAHIPLGISLGSALSALYVSVAAASAALGLQTTANAVLRSDKLNS